jgi:uncharacterized protein YggE
VSLVGFLGVACGAEQTGITVSGSGTVEAMPDTVAITASVVGSAELAGDAVQKYRGTKRRVLEALGALNIEGFTVVGSGLAVNSGTPANPMAALQGQANQPKVADKVAIEENLDLTLTGIDAMSADNLLESLMRILDVAKDAGVIIGESPQGMLQVQLRGAKPAALATFKLSNADAQRQQAYAAALKHARAKAEGLAQLAGVELGEIVSIRETVPAAQGDDSGDGVSAYLALFGMGSKNQTDAYTSSEFKNIPVTVSLNVQFATVKKK